MLNKQGTFGPNERYRRDPALPGTSVGHNGLAPSPVEPLRPDDHPKTHPEPAKPRADAEKGSRLIVGPDIKLKGAEITDCDTLIVEGRVEASMDARVIQITDTGSYQGTVGVDVAEVRGRFEGELTARKQLIVRPGGRVSGKIRYGKIVVEDGGEITGDVAGLGAAKSVAISTAVTPLP